MTTHPHRAVHRRRPSQTLGRAAVAYIWSIASVAWVAAVLVLAAPAVAAAQQPTGVPTLPRDSLRKAKPKVPGEQQPGGRRVVRDSLAADSLGAAAGDSTRPPLVEWAEPDSAMQELLGRQGYSVTRYQGGHATFNAGQRTIYLVGDSGRAAVGREKTVLVSDTILYNDSTEIVRAQGDTNVLRDPSRGPDDVISYGHLVYNIGERRGQVSNVRTRMPNGGQTWVVEGSRGAFVSDTGASAEHAAFYARGGSVTSCTDTVPHYHFESQEIKLVRNRVLVSRPAVLYIYDVPVLWLPFVFQDLRSGRRSGLLTPRLGIAELVRNNPSYRRHFENFGYYWAISDYMDAQLSVDWRSSARPGDNDLDPGYVRYNGEWRYRWIDRFLSGRFAVSNEHIHDGGTNTSISWAHQQDFSQRSHLTTDFNYVTSTQVYRQNTINPYRALATIQSRANYQQQIGAASFSLGGSLKQYPGREQRDMEFPNLSMSTQPLNIGQWFTWTPTFSFNNSESRNIDQLGQGLYFYNPGPGGLAVDSNTLKRSTRNTSARFDTPLKIFGFNWRNSFAYQDALNDFPESRVVELVVPNANGGLDTVQSTRVYDRTYQTGIDWQTGIDLPSLFQSTWKLTPSVQIVNVDPAPYLLRTERTGATFVAQRKRLQYAISASPTIFGLFPGFGPVARFRHAITPTVSYSYAPATKVSDEFIAARGYSRRDYLGNLAQNSITFGLTTNIEAKLRSESDTSPEGGKKLRILSINPSSLTYDFERLAEIRRRSANPASVSWWQGLATDRFSYTLSSDLLPGFSFQSGYSLFQGSTLSDTAVFKPYRESISASFSLNRRSGILAAIGRLFGREVPTATSADTSAATPEEQGETPFERHVAQQSVAGSEARNALYNVPSGQGFQASFTFSSTRQRPVKGGNVIPNNPAAFCEPYRIVDPASYSQCIANPSTFPGYTAQPGSGNDFLNQTTVGGPIYTSPPVSTLGMQTSFNITPKWAAQWATTYDLRAQQFSSHVVTLQRELHDWRAIFSFTQSPNGAFAFTFFISLNAQPDLKFNYDRRSYGRNSTGF